jgi:hypothetical protein
MAAINLLSTDLAPSSGIAKTAKLLRTVLTVAFAIFVISVFGLVAFFSVNALVLRSSSIRQEELKSSIQNFEQTEQGLVLVKDRLVKVKEVTAKENADNEISALSKIFASVPPGVSLAEAVIAKDELDTTFVVADSGALTQFMAGLIANEDFSRIELLSFSFNPSVGYLVSVGFSSD